MKLGEFETTPGGYLKVTGQVGSGGKSSCRKQREFIAAIHVAYERGEIQPPALPPQPTAEAIGVAVAKALRGSTVTVIDFPPLRESSREIKADRKRPEPITTKTTSELLDGDEPTVGEIEALRFLAEQARFDLSTFDNDRLRLNRIDYALIQLDNVTKP